tara:strand:- start:28100 stop:29497 length:1398 start_codon:yes stop_codon:yes gene_type:complete
MATTTVSIGSNQSIATVTPASSSTVSGEYVITFTSSVSANAAVGDIFVITDESSFMGTTTYLLTAISGSNYTLKYLNDGGSGSGNQSPYNNFFDPSFQQASGTFKRAFSTITLFEAMVDDTSDLYWGSSDDLIGECHADSTFTDSGVIFNNKQSLNSVTLTVNSADRHDGTAESGMLLKPTSGTTHNYGIIQSEIANFTLEWLDISLDSLNSTATNIAFRNNAGDDAIIRNCLLHDKYGNPGTSGPRVIFCDRMSSGSTFKIQNNILYRFHETSNDTTIAIMVHNANPGDEGGVKIYNNTIYFVDSAGSSKHAQGIYFAGGYADEVKNNIVAGLYASGASDHERAYQAQFYDYADIATNLSDTTTHSTYNAKDMGKSYNDTSALIGKSLTDIDFISTSAGSEDLHIGDDSVALQAGTDLGNSDNVQYDIDGTDRYTTNVTWDIGADQHSLGSSGGGGGMLLLGVG